MVTPPWPSAVTVTEINPPLTTPWHVPESCTWTYAAQQQQRHTTVANGDDDHDNVVAWLDLEPQSDATTLSCYPSGMFDGDVWGVFSPASCPHGWTTVGISAESTEGMAVEDVVTTATCCSS